jgi:hypothetical protein
LDCGKRRENPFALNGFFRIARQNGKAGWNHPAGFNRRRQAMLTHLLLLLLIVVILDRKIKVTIETR